MLICVVSKLKCVILNCYDSRQVIGLNFLLLFGSLYDKLAFFKCLFIWLCLVLDEACGIISLPLQHAGPLVAACELAVAACGL